MEVPIKNIPSYPLVLLHSTVVVVGFSTVT
jgi:hypothetical protein